MVRVYALAHGSELVGRISAEFARSSRIDMAKKFPLRPKHPERICWGCDKYCAADALMCGNGSGRTLHPAELIGEDWYLHGDWGLDLDEADDPSAHKSPANPPA